MNNFKSGFVNVIGLPNAGKSSLVNAITNTITSIVTHKPQTTRERVLQYTILINFKLYFQIVLDILKMHITNFIII